MQQRTYKTKQREIIWDYLLANSDRHITADDICDFLRKNDTPVGKSTVYRYLDKLVEENRIQKFSLGAESGACYQLVQCESCSLHYHCKCTECGKVFHIECEKLDDMNKHILSEHNFTVNPSQTVFYGCCKKCSKNK